MKERQDAWQERDDLTLAQIILESIRNGSSQLVGFEEAAERLNRTPGACGFRWNAEVRKRYENEIFEAKVIRKENKKTSKKAVSESLIAISKKDELDTQTDYSEQIIQASKHLKLQFKNMAIQIKVLSEELQCAKKEIESLKNKLISESPEINASEDYQALIKILGRARNLGVLEKLNK